MSTYKTFETPTKTLKIVYDENSDSPRSWDNLGTMLCSHGRYNLGDKQFNSQLYNSWAEAKAGLTKEHKAAIILPLYLYDHSGITMRTTSFNDNWDSGQVGFIFVSKEKIRKEYNKKRISPKLLAEVEQRLIGEVETYDQFISGEVYGFVVTDKAGNHLDSCYGFYGTDFKTNGITDHLDTDLIELLK